MVIHIHKVSISIPTGISKWIEENEDNKFEFNVMIEQIKKAYQDFYEDLQKMEDEYNKTIEYLYSKYPQYLEEIKNVEKID